MFVCVHNAGRSQMAAGFLTALSGGTIEVARERVQTGDWVGDACSPRRPGGHP